MNIHAIVAAASGDVPSTSSVSNDGSVGHIPIGQSGKSDVLARATKEHVEKFFKIVDTKIALLNEELAKAETSEQKEKIQLQLDILQDLKTNRENFANVKVSDDGKSITFKIKDFVTAEKFKDVYFIQDGAFRQELKAEYENGEENGVFVKQEKFMGFIPINILDYEAAVLTNGKEYVIPFDMLKDESALDEYLATEVQKQRELNN